MVFIISFPSSFTYMMFIFIRKEKMIKKIAKWKKNVPSWKDLHLCSLLFEKKIESVKKKLHLEGILMRLKSGGGFVSKLSNKLP